MALLRCFPHQVAEVGRMRFPDGYCAIEDYGLIGNGVTAALVSRDGSIDWACFPRFDSPSVFARILDASAGGHFQIAPRAAFSSSRCYQEDTNILITRVKAADGEAELVDFMPVERSAMSGTGASSIVRIVRGRQGRIDMRVLFAPRFDYGRAACSFDLEPGAGVKVCHGNLSLTLYSKLPMRLSGDAAVGEFTLAAGESVSFVLSARQPRSKLWQTEVLVTTDRAREETAEFWREWANQCTYQGPYRSEVRRSALVLKLLDYARSGAIIAAPTTSLPEKIGGVRNWDYRYSWLRDTAFTLRALFSLGFRREGDAFFEWITDLASADPANLQLLYGVEGETDLEEQELPHLAGYRGSRPVRIGNAAQTQLQLDLYGEVLDCAYLFHKNGGTISSELWNFLARIVDHVCHNWRRPDHGIWEVRSAPRHFVYSKALCWVAVDRGLKLASALPQHRATEPWRRTRDEIITELLSEGYNRKLGAFTQSYGSSAMDAGALAFILRQVLPASDARIQSTVNRVVETLQEGGFLRRYSTLSEDGLPPGEGVFLMCSFWLADCYAEMGRFDEASELFKSLLRRSNDLGLYAEEFDPQSSHHLGNFPQAFTHVALINTAVTLAKISRHWTR